LLENVNLTRKLSREDYKRALPTLQLRLYDLEKACWDKGVPTMVVFEGLDAAGKGTAIAALTERLDPRGFRLYPITAPRTYEQQYPWLWRFWLKTPNRGDMLLFDHSWYERVLGERVDGTIPEKAWRQAYRDIAEFERMLADDRTVILKFFLHISKEEQLKRFKERLDDPSKHWKISEADYKERGFWDDYIAGYEEALSRCSTKCAPWFVIPANHKWFRNLAIARIVVEHLESLKMQYPKPTVDLKCIRREYHAAERDA